MRALDRVDDPRVQRAASLLEQAAVGDLVGQRMLEGVLELRERVASRTGTRRPAARPDRSAQRRPRHPRQSPGAARTARPCRSPTPSARDALSPDCEPVDARRQHRLHRGRDLDGWQRPRQPIAASLADAGTPISTSARTLSSRKNGFPSVRAINTRLSASRPASAPSSATRSSSAVSGGSGSSRSWV